MKTLILSLFTFLLATFTANNAYAVVGGSSFLFEPSVGYRNETIQFTNKIQIETKMKTALPVYGLKLGYRSPIGVDLNLAGDYSKGKVEISGESDKSDFSHQTASVQLGINALGAMKIYLGYGFLNEFKVEESLTLAAFKLSGPAYIAGLQLKLFPHLNLGAQYNLNQFKKIVGKAYALGDETETYFTKIDTQDYSLYLSLDF